MKVSVLVVLVLLGLPGCLLGANFTSVASGNWNAGATWGFVCGPCTAGTHFPGAADNATIASAHTVTVNVASACINLTMNGTAILNGAALNLAISGNLTMNGTSQLNTGTYTVGGNFSVPALQSATFGGIGITITGTTTIAGNFVFAISGGGTKRFNNTITVAVGGTWDNVVGEDPEVNCSIVNNGNWPIPTGGNGRYDVRLGGPYTYSGSREIAMTRLNLVATFVSSVTNLGILRLTRTGNPPEALTVAAGGASFSNGDGVAAAYLYFASIPTSASGAGVINFANANNTVDYTNAGAQTIYTTTYYNLKCSTSGIKTLSGNTTVTNEVNITGSAILDANTQALTGPANLVMTGTGELRLSRIGVTLPALTGTANSLAAGTTITFNGAGAQTAKGSSAVNPSTTNTYPYQNINLSGNLAASNVDFTNVSLVNGNLTFTDRGRINSNPVMTVGGTFFFGLPAPAVSLTATTVLNANITVGSMVIEGGVGSVLNFTNRTITITGVNGTWTNNGGATFSNNASSLVLFQTGTNQLINGVVPTQFPNLTINNANGVSLSGVDAQVQNTLTFTVGNLITGSNSIYAGGPVVRTSGFVEGNLQKDVATGASTSVTYEVGTGTTYAPVNLVFTTVGTAGTVTCSSTVGDNPDVNASNIEPNKTANRSWSITNSGTIFTSYAATFNFAGGVPVDLDALANPANFQVKRTDGLNWFATTVGVRTGTSTQFTAEPFVNLPNLTRQDFQCGEVIITTGILNRVTGPNNWNNQATWIENRTGSITFNGTVNVVGVGTLFLTELADGDIIMLQTSPGTVRGTVAPGGRTSNTTLTLVAAAGAAAGGYGRQRIPNAIGDAVTIGNSNIAPDAATTISFDMPGATTINSLDINTAATPRATAQILNHTVSSLLTIQTTANVNQPGAAATDTWNIGTGRATVNGNLTIGSADATLNRIANVSIATPAVANTGLTVGNLIFNSTAAAGREVTAVLDMSGGAGFITVLNQLLFNNNTGRLIPGATSTFIYQRSAGSQRVNWPNGNTLGTQWIYNNLWLRNTSAAGAFIQAGDDITAAASATTINVIGDLRIETGLLVTSNNTNITGAGAKTFQVDPGATFSMTGNLSTFPTGFGTFSLGTAAPFGLVSYEQSNAVTVAAPALGFGSLQVLNDGFTVTLPGTLAVAGNLIVGDGTTAPTLRGFNTTSFTVNNNVTINSGATLNANVNGRIRSFGVGGNWSNSGTFTPSATVADAGLLFTGGGTQTVGGSSADSFFKMTLNTVATTNTVQLLKSITVTNVLTLTRGGLDLNGRIINITNPAVGAMVSGGAFPSQGYVKSESTSLPYGEVKWSVGAAAGVYVYPFGKSSTEYIPLTVNVTTAGAPGAGIISVFTYGSATNNTPLPSAVTNLNGTTGGNSVVDRFWGITLSGYSTTRPTATLIFTAVGGSAPTLTPPSERPGTIANLATVTASPAGIAAQSWNPAAYWDPAPAGQTFANNSPNNGFFRVTAPGVQLQNTYVPFTLTDASVPLPIELVDFNADVKGGVVNVIWKTETELNNDFFTVQRTVNAEVFQDVVNVKGGGTTILPKTYSALDDNPLPGKSYYRLKQTDFDGRFSYSKLVAVDVSSSMVWKVYPNPSNGYDLYMSFSPSDIGKMASIRITDVTGKEILPGASLVLKQTEVKLEVKDPIPAGMYILSIAVEQQVSRMKLIVK